ncbi:MAG: lipoate--protein ligase family protein [Candidatus Cloacimonetes bacterium]|nr:lipoate--protein ligase family protein [Candidatus Cloacimonadota bacterium]
MKWRFLINSKLSPAENMAIDEAIFESIQDGRSLPTIRFYGWDPSTVSCGYNQEVSKEVDFMALKEYGFGFVRRPTGGRLVLHDDEVTYSVISPASGRLSGNITESYSEISKALALGLEHIGIVVDFEKGNLTSEHQRQVANPCFTSSSRYELNYQKKKIVGSAQVRKNNCILQHGSILLNHGQSKLAKILPGLTIDQKERMVKYLNRKTIGINEILEMPISYKTAVNYLIKGFKEKWIKDDFVIHKNLETYELDIAEKLRISKYLTDEWNQKK